MSLNRDENRFDILRLLAAWLVLFSHCFPLTGRPQDEPLGRLGIDTFGGVGVAIFFVLSGYLVTVSLERNRNLLAFLRKRVFRIYPGLIVVCLLCALVLGPLLTTLPQAAYWRHDGTWIYLHTAGAWDIEFALPAVFADNPYPWVVNGSLWSLPYEITCYLVLALLSLVPGPMRIKVALIAAALVVMVTVRPPEPAFSTHALFLGMDYYHGKLGLLFALGSVFACWRARIEPRLWFALPMLVLALLLPYAQLKLLFYILGLGTLVLWLALYGLWLPRIPARVGDWSYGAYLYGFPVQQVLAHFRLHEASFAGYVLACTVLTFALAGLSWHLVEKPALRWK